MKAWFAAHWRALGLALGNLAAQPLGSLLSSLVIGLALALPATGLALFDSLASLASGVSGRPEMTLFLKDDTSAEERAKLERTLRNDASLSALRFVSRDEARTDLARNGLADVLDTLPANPLPDAFILTLRDPDPTAFEAVHARYAHHARVEHAQVDTLWVQRLTALIDFGRLVMYLLAGVLGSALVIITFNTIRLQIMTRREEIEVSRVLGATTPFIRRPFYWLGGLQGLGGGLFAWGIAALSLELLAPAVERIAQTYGTVFSLGRLAPEAVGLLLGFAALLGLAGSALALRRHL